MKTKTDNYAEDQAAAQYSSIVRMLAALNCDYNRLTELKDEREELTESVKDSETDNHAEALEALTQWESDNAEELTELEDAAGGCTDEDAARNNIHDDPLAIQVRSDWMNLGEPLEAGEFMILLCTGGPAVRIVGELSRGEPCRAWLEYQDLGTQWTHWFGASSDTLCQYAAIFFGE